MNTRSAGRKDIGCEEALRRLAEYLDGELTDTSDTDVSEHLETCRSCYSRVEFEKGLKSRLREMREAPVDPAFEQRICDLANEFTSS